VRGGRIQFCALRARGGVADLAGGVAVVPPAESTRMIGVPTSTVVPSSASSSVTVPANGDGSSTSDFAVSISTST
jgi:hypothetical protein